MRLLSLLFLSLFFLSACTTMNSNLPTSNVKVDWQSRETQLMQITHWKLNGKIAVRTQKDAGSAIVNWTEDRGNYQLSLTGPLGAGAMQLTGDAKQITLRMPDGKIYTANTPEQLLREQWGYLIPVSNLRYWIKGLPVPGIASSKQFDDYQRLAQLTQVGWVIKYEDYTKIGQIELPKRLMLTSEWINIKLVIHQWDI